MNTNTSYNMMSALKELYSDPSPTREETMYILLYRLDLSEYNPLAGLRGWLPFGTSPFFGMIPKSNNWQGGLLPVPFEYSKPASPSKEANPKLNRKQRRTKEAQDRKAK